MSHCTPTTKNGRPGLGSPVIRTKFVFLNLGTPTTQSSSVLFIIAHDGRHLKNRMDCVLVEEEIFISLFQYREACRRVRAAKRTRRKLSKTCVFGKLLHPKGVPADDERKNIGPETSRLRGPGLYINFKPAVILKRLSSFLTSNGRCGRPCHWRDSEPTRTGCDAFGHAPAFHSTAL